MPELYGASADLLGRRHRLSHPIAIVAAMANQSLYRRYRPRRFSEIRGQDHVVKALRTSVAEGREGQAYLFSGPRGTGKTTTARILAKVLNCENPVDGEPCCVCASCVAVERGTSYDVHELDAASNNGVDAMRDLIDKTLLGTPGRNKVYILDEVHMLSKAAEAALLKTLEEPPSHVVFVLATTDPQKVSDTIISRTQHLQFHLLNNQTLSDHVRWVIADAGLTLSDAAVDQVVRNGAGSARDALSALELMASTGDDGIESIPFDEFVEAMIERDPGRALTMVAFAISIGRDPRSLTEELVAHLRNGFLSLMAPELVQVSSHDLDALAEQAGRLGAAGLVRGIEVLGAVLADMRHAPDPRVLLDVAAVQLTSEAVSPDLGALLARLHRLEQQLAAGVPVVEPTSVAEKATGRVALGGRARTGASPASSESGPPSTTESPPSATIGATREPLSVETWEQQVRPTLRGIVRAVYAPASLASSTPTSVTLLLPNAAHREKCEQHREALEQAITSATGIGIAVHLVVEGELDPVVVPEVEVGDHDVDLDDLTDAPAEAVKSPIDRLAEAFPGSELIEDETTR
jgi:DNA polymerase-3 subunit gamma/tau